MHSNLHSRRRCLRAALLFLVLGLSTAGAVPIQWSSAVGGNDHFYDLILSDDVISWHESQAAAQAAGGYLASITSSAENDFVTALTGGVEAYIGATDEGLEGTFVWINGDPFGFANWAFGEPNDDMGPASPLGEDYAIINPPAQGNPLGVWNDVPDNPLRVRAYVVEFDQTPIPEPSTVSLLLAGAVLFGCVRRFVSRS